MVGNFLQKMQMARQEFEQGKAIHEILFSDNPGFIPKGRIPLMAKVYPPLIPASLKEKFTNAQALREKVFATRHR